MKMRNILLLAVIAALPASVSADSFLSEDSVTFRGELNARKVCKAVVYDDPEKLNAIFKQDLRRNLYRYQRAIRDRAMGENYFCNDLSLLPFADQIGAVKVSGYLRKGKGTVIMEEMVSTID